MNVNAAPDLVTEVIALPVPVVEIEVAEPPSKVEILEIALIRLLFIELIVYALKVLVRSVSEYVPPKPEEP